MNETEVVELVADQLRGRVESRLGWRFKDRLVQPPERAIFRSPDGRPWPLWIVLRESADGYAIGYDEEDRSFQLVSGGVVVSGSPTLMDAIDGM